MPRIERCEKISKIVAYSSIILLSIAILAVTILSVLPHLTNKCIEFPYPPSPISFTHYGNGTGEVSWNVYPTDVSCGVSYNLLFIYGGVEWTNYTTDNFVKLGSLHECTLLVVRIWAMSTLGQNSTYYREQKISVAPPNQQITDILFEEINRSLHLTWDKPENLTGCEVAYYVSYSTTLVQMTGYTQSTGYTIDFNNFCFHVFVEIEVLVDGEYNSITSDEYHTTPNVDNFRIDQINDTNIVLKWDPHPRGERCFLRYKVVRIINGEESEVVETRLNSCTFEYNYCEDTKFRIIAFSSNSESAPVSIDATQCNSLI